MVGMRHCSTYQSTTFNAGRGFNNNRYRGCARVSFNIEIKISVVGLAQDLQVFMSLSKLVLETHLETHHHSKTCETW